MEVDVIMPVNLDTVDRKIMTENALVSLKQSEKDIHFNEIVVVDEEIKDYNYNAMLCIGLHHSKNEWTILTNNDVLFHEGFMSKIISIYEQDKTIRSFGVWEDTFSPRYFDGKKEWYVGYRTSKEITGWCLVVRRDVLQEIDFCNTKNQRVNHWYSDNIYADLLQKHKIIHALVRDAKVTHLLNGTTKTMSRQKQYELQQGQSKNYYSG